MLIKALILSAALFAHMWLWGQWSLEKSIGQTLMLSVASLLFIVLVVVPVRGLVKKQGFFVCFSKLWFRSIVYLYILLIVFLSAVSFTGLIQYLLPVKLLLIAVYSFLKYKFWNKKAEKTT